MSGKPIFKKLSSKVVSGFIAVVVVFSLLGMVITRQLGEMRSASAEAMDRAGAVQDIKDVTAAASQQMQQVYELILGDDLDRLSAFDEAAGRRKEALAAATTHAETAQEKEYFEQLSQAAERFDDIVINELVPAWEAGDFNEALQHEKQADAVLVSIRNKATIITSSFDERSIQAREASERASAEARSYLILAAIVGSSLSLFVTIITFRRLNRPVRELKEASMAMVQGDMERRVRVTTEDEVGELGESFNLMAAAVQGKIGQLTNLSDIALAISSELDWSRVLDVVMDKGIEVTGSDAAAIVLYDEEKRQFTDVYSRGLSEEFTGKMRFRRGGLAERVLFGDQAVFSDDIQAPYRLSRLAREEGVTAFICLPLKVRKRKLGIFYVYSRTMEAYGREEVAVLSILSNQAAIAIQNAMMFERSQEKALTDGLTGLYNQRHFYTRLKEEVERATRNRKPLSVIFCDLDHFKSFNDKHGHALGDKALRETGRILVDSKRAIDVAARYGGEEFAIVLPDTDSAGAQIIAHRIRRRVAALEFESQKHGIVSLTISIGVASFPEDASVAQELVDKADWSMYYSKRSGRDRVTLFHEVSDEYGNLNTADLVREEFHIAAAEAIAASVASRINKDGEHPESVARLSSLIAEALEMEEEEVQQIRIAGLLHDIGLVSVPEDIIRKKEDLDEEDWRRIRQHPEVGAEILKHISSLEGFLPLVRHHHERFDGDGYPDGLSREEIPLGARIIAVADAYQAMINSRPYRLPMAPTQALLELQKEAGKQFDPTVVEMFTGLMGDCEAKAS